MESQSTLPNKVSRPYKPIALQLQVASLHGQGKSNSEIARELSIDVSTVGRILARAKIPQIEQRTIENVFADIGLTPKFVGENLRALTGANDVRLATLDGKFTDRLDVPDNAARFRATELTAKILSMLPREDAASTAQLFVRLPDIQLVIGHGNTCLCPDCRRAWESLPVESSEPDK